VFHLRLLTSHVFSNCYGVCLEVVKQEDNISDIHDLSFDGNGLYYMMPSP